MANYSEAEDLLLGDVPLPAFVDQAKLIRDATDEIDSRIGFIYKTPVDMSETGPVSRPARLLLKRVSAHLSSGRLIMAAAAGSQDENTNSYGRYLIKSALDTLRWIEEGRIDLDGAEKVGSDEQAPTGPLISNIDPESNVEAFYNRLTNGTSVATLGLPRRAGG